MSAFITAVMDAIAGMDAITGMAVLHVAFYVPYFYFFYWDMKKNPLKPGGSFYD